MVTPSPRSRKTPKSMTRAEYARHRGCHRSAVTRAINDGRITLDADGRIDPAEADRAWNNNTDPTMQRTGRASNSSNLAAAKAKNMQLAARERELRIQQREGQLVAADAVKRVFATTMIEIRESLRSLPKSLAGDVTPEVKDKIENAIRDCLDRAATNLETLFKQRIA